MTILLFFIKCKTCGKSPFNATKSPLALAKQAPTSYIGAHDDEYSNPFQPLVVGL